MDPRDGAEYAAWRARAAEATQGAAIPGEVPDRPKGEHDDWLEAQLAQFKNPAPQD